jgi:deoxyribonuclease V
MEPRHKHSWEVSVTEAKIIQNRLRNRVVLTDWTGAVGTIAGIQCYDLKKQTAILATICTLSFPALAAVEKRSAYCPSKFPYIPGLLVFHWGHCIVRLLQQLTVSPDLLMLAAHGYSHPRRIGLATHIGILFDMPSIGIAKTRLWGKYREPGFVAGSRTFVQDEGEIIGALVRTRTGADPLFISSGHKVSLETAVDIVLRCCRRSRFPEPIRQAYWFVRRSAPTLK